MSSQQFKRTPRWFPVAILVGTLLAGLVAQQPARAADFDKLDSSLKWVPADAAFYASWMRNREQVEAVTKSNAWAKLMALPSVQQMWQQAQLALDQSQEWAQFRKMLEQPENKQLVEVLLDMVSNEVFFYGGQDTLGNLDLLGQLYTAATTGPALMELKGKGVDPSRAPGIAAARLLSEKANSIKAPDLVLGFKLTKAEPAEKQLQRLEDVLKPLVEQNPKLKGRLNRVKVGQDSYLTLSLDGTMVPWDEIPFKEIEEKPGEYDGLVKKLKELKMTISIGIHDGYLLVSTGKDTTHLARLGKDKRLVDLPEFKPLAKHADKRLTSVAYVSVDMNARLTSSKDLFDTYINAVKTALTDAKLTDDQRKRISADLDALSKDLKTLMPAPGAQLSFAFLNGHGYEGYAYDWSGHKHIDGSKPLTLLNHVGGTPIFAAVGRTKYSIEEYQMLVKWIKVGGNYFEELVVPTLEGEEKEKAQKVLKAVQPLLKRLDDTTGKMLLPALADGQTGIVLDAKLTSKKWHEAMPPSDKPLPMLEPAVVAGVSDAALLEKAMGEYRSIANDLIGVIRQFDTKKEIPAEFKIPEPEIRKVTAGKIYAYALPKELGLSKQILPNAGLSDKVAVLTISQEHSERLLTSTPLKVTSGPLADLKKPMAGAAYFNWPALVDAVTPWIDYSVSQWAAQAGADEKAVAEIMKQVHSGLEVLKVCRTFSSSTYIEDGVLVTHSETVIEDLPK